MLTEFLDTPFFVNHALTSLPYPFVWLRVVNSTHIFPSNIRFLKLTIAQSVSPRQVLIATLPSMREPSVVQFGLSRRDGLRYSGTIIVDLSIL